MNAITSNRYIRQKDIIPSDRLAQFRPIVVGCGAVGSLVVRQLAHIGCPDIAICDFDTVDEVNLACQGFLETDLCETKVDALARHIAEINSHCHVNIINRRFSRSRDDDYDVVFCCVDSIQTRELIWRAVKDKAAGFFDARLKGGDSIRILSATDEQSRKHYPGTLFSAEQVQQGACTAKMTIYGAYVAAGLLISRYAQFLRRFPITDCDFMLNLTACELSAS